MTRDIKKTIDKKKDEIRELETKISGINNEINRLVSTLPGQSCENCYFNQEGRKRYGPGSKCDWCGAYDYSNWYPSNGYWNKDWERGELDDG